LPKNKKKKEKREEDDISTEKIKEGNKTAVP